MRFLKAVIAVRFGKDIVVATGILITLVSGPTSEAGLPVEWVGRVTSWGCRESAAMELDTPAYTSSTRTG